VGEEETRGSRAKVLGVEPMTRGRHRVRLLFHEPCPTYFLRAAVLGPSESAPVGPEEADVEARWAEAPGGETTRDVLSR
jgi:hypothetical protein